MTRDGSNTLSPPIWRRRSATRAAPRSLSITKSGTTLTISPTSTCSRLACLAMIFAMACMVDSGLVLDELYFPPFDRLLLDRAHDQPLRDIAHHADQNHRHHQIGGAELIARFHQNRTDSGFRCE